VLTGEREATTTLEPVIVEAYEQGTPLMVLAGAAATLGPTALLLAEMAALLGRTADARARYDEAIDLAERLGVRIYADRARAARERLGGASARPPPSARSGGPPAITLTQEGEMWTLRAGDEAWNLKASKGLSYLSVLIAHPHEEIHVAQLVGAAGEVTGDAGPHLDETAKASYRRRAAELRAELDEATSNADIGRVEKARAELDALGDELARAVGLGGRDRKAASDVERMRVNVQRRLRDAIERVRAQSPAVGRYLDASVRTGSFCCYAPAWTGKQG
jgi:non-specific serine/threonine protein kinase